MMMSIMGIVFLFGILIILLPDFGEISKERMASTSMMMCTGKIRTAIKAELEKGSPIKTDYEVKCPKLINQIVVHEDGGIKVFNPTYKIQLSFKPTLKDGKVKWSCQGTPAAFVPAQCKVESGTK